MTGAGAGKVSREEKSACQSTGQFINQPVSESASQCSLDVQVQGTGKTHSTSGSNTLNHTN